MSHTTRAPRAGEVDGGDYHFVSRDAFDQMVEAGRFLEWARVHDHQYGTSLDEVMPRLADGIDVLLDIDVQGARLVLDNRKSGLAPGDVHGIFVLPPTYGELKKRLLARNLDREEVIDRRLTVALQEIQSFANYEYVIINHDHQRGESCARLDHPGKTTSSGSNARPGRGRARGISTHAESLPDRDPARADAVLRKEPHGEFRRQQGR